MEIIFFTAVIILLTIIALKWGGNPSKKEPEEKQKDLRLTIKAIIRWEQLNKKPFSGLNYNNEDEIISLFYTCTLSDVIKKSFAEFRKELTEEKIKEMFSDFERQTHLVSQFQAVSKKEEKDPEDSNPVYIKDIVSLLVMNGLDVYFSLNDMELCDLPVFLQAYDQKRKDELTFQRLWAFMQLSPHLKKGVTPKKFYPFAWELEEEIISEEEQKKRKEESISFLKTGLKV